MILLRCVVQTMSFTLKQIVGSKRVMKHKGAQLLSQGGPREVVLRNDGLLFTRVDKDCQNKSECRALSYLWGAAVKVTYFGVSYIVSIANCASM
mmetsp:Transcript_4722/g.10088  ORF Transcript_4722/g.10088 Transcript_4722/m.10088 type:complete len:94 (+) Transcript_4722:482-763(+)